MGAPLVRPLCRQCPLFVSRLREMVLARVLPAYLFCSFESLCRGRPGACCCSGLRRLYRVLMATSAVAGTRTSSESAAGCNIREGRLASFLSRRYTQVSTRAGRQDGDDTLQRFNAFVRHDIAPGVNSALVTSTRFSQVPVESALSDSARVLTTGRSRRVGDRHDHLPGRPRRGGARGCRPGRGSTRGRPHRVQDGLHHVRGAQPVRGTQVGLDDTARSRRGHRSRERLIVRRSGKRHIVYLGDFTYRCTSAWLRERHRRRPVTINPHPFALPLLEAHNERGRCADDYRATALDASGHLISRKAEVLRLDGGEPYVSGAAYSSAVCDCRKEGPYPARRAPSRSASAKP